MDRPCISEYYLAQVSSRRSREISPPVAVPNKKEIDTVRQIFGPKVKIHFHNLQSPIEVGDHSGTHVELLINYTMDVLLED